MSLANSWSCRYAFRAATGSMPTSSHQLVCLVQHSAIVVLYVSATTCAECHGPELAVLCCVCCAAQDLLYMQLCTAVLCCCAVLSCAVLCCAAVPWR